jgi:hypothetical protein
MSLRLGALHDALLEAGATPESAPKAAEEVANYEARLAAIGRGLSVLKWMAGTNIALTGAVLVRLLVV